MYAEAFRPTFLNEVIGHQNVKEALKEYLHSNFSGALMLVGSPGIGKTTMALCATNTYGFEALEINASKSIRTFEDVQKLRDSCRSAISIQSFLLGNKKKTCVILDEVDGSDPHAQAKIIDWIKDTSRVVPIICTGNELPTIFKRNSCVTAIRCYPPKAVELQALFPNDDVLLLLKECQHDVRRVIHRLQYGESYILPQFSYSSVVPELQFLERQKELPDPLEYLCGKLGNGHSHETNLKYTSGDKHVDIPVVSRRRKLRRPDKLHNSDVVAQQV